MLCVVDPLQRCRRRRRLPPVHRLPSGGDLWREQNNVVTSAATFYQVDGKDVRLTTGDSSSNPVERDILPHRHSQLSDLTIRLCSTTSLKSISLKWWLYQQMFKLTFDQFNSQDANLVISHSLIWLINRLTTDVGLYRDRWRDHKYVNIHIHQLFVFSKSVMDNRWQWLSLNAKLARD